MLFVITVEFGNKYVANSNLQALLKVKFGWTDAQANRLYPIMPFTGIAGLAIGYAASGKMMKHGRRITIIYGLC